MDEISFNYEVKDFHEELTYSGRKFACLLKAELMKGKLELSDRFYKGHDNFKKKFAEHLLSNEKVAEHDDFRYNVLIDCLVKSDFKKSNKFKTDNEFEEYVEQLVIYIITKGESLLSNLYYEGETQMFMLEDGDIYPDFVIKEKEDGVYIYAYYKYLSK